MAELQNALFVEEDVMNFLKRGEQLHKGVRWDSPRNIDDTTPFFMLGDALEIAEERHAHRPRLKGKEGIGIPL